MKVKRDMLKKLKMPMGDEGSDPMLVEDEGSGEDMAEDKEEGLPVEEGAKADSSAPALADVSDDELLAEIKKRGLSPEAPSAAPAEDEFSMPEEMPA